VDESVVMISEKLTQVSSAYLAQDLDTKKKNLEKDGNNLGFVHINNVREYIKLRPSDAEYLWPTYPPDFKSVFDEFFKIYSQIAFSSFDILAEFVEPNPENPQEALPFIKPGHVDAIKEFLQEKSSVSIIKYFELKEPAEVCADHTDTGILTFITRTYHPSLEIWDKKEQKFVKIEELLQAGDVIAFIGEKIPLFSCSDKMSATPHRVKMCPGSERISIAFLLDVAK
jgi:isopenicillin N synthase-like dioxygenase